MTDSTKLPASTLILLGATGDLSQRMLISSLYGLHAEGLLPADFRRLFYAPGFLPFNPIGRPGW